MVKIRFLKPGLVEAAEPDNFNEMTKEEKIAWATDYLSRMGNDELLVAMLDYTEGEMLRLSMKDMADGIFDEAPVAEAVELDMTGEKFVGTKAWLKFSNLEGDGVDVIDFGGAECTTVTK